jgi:hypothetical protein
MKKTQEASSKEPWGKPKVLPKVMVSDFRKTFLSSEEGMRVLLHLGESMYFFSECIETTEQQLLSNAFKDILIKCGIWLQPNSMAILKALKKVKLIEKEDKPVPKGKLAQLMEQKYGS